MKQWNECDEVDDNADHILRWFSGIALFAVILCGFIMIPRIVTHVKGFKLMTIILQQLCLGFHLVLIVLYHSLATASIYSFFDDVKEKRNFNLDFSQIGHTISSFFYQYFHAHYYFFSLLQSLDAYTMVCKPMDYKEFTDRTHLCGLLFKGSFACLLYSSPHLILLLFPAYMSLDNSDASLFIMRMNIKWWMNVFHVFKLFLCKLFYIMVVFYMAKMIKTKFKESDELVNNQRSNAVHKRIFRFALIPVFLNFMFLPAESLKAFFSFYTFAIMDCSHWSMFSIRVAFQSLRVTALLVASLFSYAAYVVLFSNLRKSFHINGDDDNNNDQ